MAPAIGELHPDFATSRAVLGFTDFAPEERLLLAELSGAATRHLINSTDETP